MKTKDKVVLSMVFVLLIISALTAFYSDNINLNFDKGPLQMFFLLPMLSFIVVIGQNIVGLRTFGTFGPVILGLSFLQIGIIKALFLYVIILGAGIILHKLLSNLSILSTNLTSINLYFVALIMGILFHLLGIELGNFVQYPFLITAFIIDRFNTITESKGYNEAILLLLQTILVALSAAIFAKVILTFNLSTTLAFFILSLSINLLISLYKGVRLLELIRFKNLIK